MTTLNKHPIYTKTLNHARCEIRLLTIHGNDEPLVACSMKVVSLPDKPRFAALSYTWGNPEHKKQILVNGEKVQVTVNLEGALRRLRSLKNPPDMWADALCIDQADQSDKNYQIPLMEQIYSDAIRVFAWLGESDETAGPFLDSLKEIGGGRKISIGELSGPPSDRELRGLIRAHILGRSTIERPFWRRIWIVQELFLPKIPPMVLLGAYSIDLDLFLNGIRAIINTLPYITQEAWDAVAQELTLSIGPLPSMGTIADIDTPLWKGYNSIASLSQTLSQIEVKKTGVSMSQALTSTCAREATDGRDRVYALLGLVSEADRKQITVNYAANPMKVFQETMASIWKSGKLSLVSSFDYSPASCHGSKDYPSWVPDICCQQTKFLATIPKGDATWSQGSPAMISRDGNSIICHGIQFDTVNHFISLDTPTTLEEVQTLRDCILHQYDSGISLNHPLLTTFRMIQDHAMKAINLPLEPRHRLHCLYLCKKVEQIWQILIGNKHLNPETRIPQADFSAIWAEIVAGEPIISLSNASTGPENDLPGQFSALLRDLVNMLPKALPKKPTAAAVATIFEKFAMAFRDFTSKRSILFTKAGFVGVGPLNIKEEDVIVIIHGMNVPMVLRPHEKGGYYTMVGSAFVSGIMNFGLLEMFLTSGILDLEEVVFQLR